VTPSDYSDVGGLMLMSWAIGYCAGYLMKAVRRLFESAGGGSG